MPRKAKGQRTDLNQAIKVAPSQQYGQAAQQLASQRVVPLPDNQASQLAVASTQAVGTAPAPTLADLGAFDRPTERPGESLTAGLSLGAGPGPEVLSQFTDPDALNLDRLRSYLPALEVLAGLPNASIQTRNFVRRIRGAMPLQTPEG